MIIPKLLAQNPTFIGHIGSVGPQDNSLEPLSFLTGNGIQQIAMVISLIVSFLTVVAGLFFMFQLIIGGLAWISSTGDKNKLQEAQNRITNAFLGLIVVAAAYGLTALAGSILGLDILLKGNVLDILKLQ